MKDEWVAQTTDTGTGTASAPSDERVMPPCSNQTHEWAEIHRYGPRLFSSWVALHWCRVCGALKMEKSEGYDSEIVYPQAHGGGVQ